MTKRQQRRAEKQKKTLPVSQVQKPMTKSKQAMKNAIKNIKEPKLERLSSIMKGLLVYKTETAEMWRLIEKYPEQLSTYNVAYA